MTTMQPTQETLLGYWIDREIVRVSLMCQCLHLSRHHEEIPQDIQEQLSLTQANLSSLRTQWSERLNLDHLNLTSRDWDILFFVLAPEFDPYVARTFYALQKENPQVRPSQCFISECLFLVPSEVTEFRNHFQWQQPLFAGGLLQGDPDDFFAPLSPSRSLMNLMLERPVPFTTEIPGATPINKKVAWNELVVSDECRRILREFVTYERQQHQVFKHWKMHASGGPIALFSGPSGTGKTMAAAVIAQELGYPLYRIDLGMLVSKYIGETEKNLNALFRAARGVKALLLFDEADSLFGKRGEVKDARDRYANMEISHLLIRMEEHHGPCILTTNLRNHIDTAFCRRFTFTAEFNHPEASTRHQIWSQVLHDQIPLDSEVSIDQLSEQLRLSGAQIHSIAKLAACQAKEDQQPIGNAHLARAVYVELNKSGQEVVASDLGFLQEAL